MYIKRAKQQAKAQLESIIELVDALEKARDADDQMAIDEAERAIHEDALSVEVRSDWHVPGTESEEIEFLILLCTGGPAVRIIGELGRFNEPEKARIEYQDWFTPWTEYTDTNSETDEKLLAFCRKFYFGD